MIIFSAMSKGAVLFFSMTGNNKRFASKASAEKKYDLIELFPGNFLRVFSIPFNSLARSAIKKLSLEKYSDIIIYSPVWAGKPSPAVTELIKSGKLKGKRLRINLTHMGGNDCTEKEVNLLVKSNSLRILSIKMTDLRKK